MCKLLRDHNRALEREVELLKSN